VKIKVVFISVYYSSVMFFHTESEIKTETLCRLRPEPDAPEDPKHKKDDLNLSRCGNIFLVFEYIQVSYNLVVPAFSILACDLIIVVVNSMISVD
jgi:hypothetical protein